VNIPATSTRLRSGVVVAVAGLGIGALSWSGLSQSVTYYRTPSEVVDHPPPAHQRVRLGGLVVRGSVVRYADGTVRMTITDGVDDVPVIDTGSLPQIFREGQGAVVEGTMGPGGEFHADRVLVRHSNEYRPPGGTGA
jgi:cytochrome c-type biogenesis protein CcmE